METEFDITRPIYLQIVELIKVRAVREFYPPGSRVPSIRDMATEMKVNPNTVTRAYMELERDGFIFTKRGQGSFITEDKERMNKEKTDLASQATQLFISNIKGLGLSKIQLNEIFGQMKKELDVAEN